MQDKDNQVKIDITLKIIVGCPVEFLISSGLKD